jgi:glycosyltransferase involved in cell wall biosynthesis
MRAKTEEKRHPALVAIALAAYKPKPRFFSQQLQSLVDQTHQNWVCVITFDSSMRETLKNPSIKKFKKDKRFVWHQNSRQLGLVRNFERAMALSLAYRPNAIAFCDQDDIWLSNKLEVSIDALRRQRPMSLVHCDAIVRSDAQTFSFSNWTDLNPLPRMASVRHLLLRNTVSGAGALFDARLATIAKKAPSFPFLFHDGWVALAAALNGGVYPIEEKLYVYRQHAGNVLGSSQVRREKDQLAREKRRQTQGRITLKRRLQRLHSCLLRSSDFFTNSKLIALNISTKLRAGDRYRSRTFLALIFLWCAIEYAILGGNYRFALRVAIVGALSPFRRSNLRNIFSLSRRRSAPRHRS